MRQQWGPAVTAVRLKGVCVGAGALWCAVAARAGEARASGALSPMRSEDTIVEDGGVPFVVRRLMGHDEKRAAAGRMQRDPPCEFPLEPALVVREVGDTHLALLNKYPVLPQHLLLVTRRYVPQETLLDRADFEALASCRREGAALAFFNGGAVAGASQAHKHLQIVPLSHGAQGALPIESLLARLPHATGVLQVPSFRFRHAFSWCQPDASAQELLENYGELLLQAGVGPSAGDIPAMQSEPYNMLLAPQWMLVVARADPCWQNISINSLGFAGSLAVCNTAELEAVRAVGPMAILHAVAAR